LGGQWGYVNQQKGNNEKVVLLIGKRQERNESSEKEKQLPKGENRTRKRGEKIR